MSSIEEKQILLAALLKEEEIRKRKRGIRMTDDKKLLEWVYAHAHGSCIVGEITVIGVNIQLLQNAITSGELEPDASGDVKKALDRIGDIVDDVKDALDYGTSDEEIKHYNDAISDYTLAIQALRQMEKIEPCKHCEIAELHNEFGTIPHYNNCPQCGRKLEVK